EEMVRQYIQLDPEGLHPRTELSKIYQKQGKWKEAEEMVRQYIQLDPEGLHPRTELSKIYQKQGKWKEAEEVLNRLIHFAPKNVYAYTEYGRLHSFWSQAIRSQDRKKANQLIWVYRNYIAKSYWVDKTNLPSLMELAKIYRFWRQPRAAIAFIDQALRIQPKDLTSLLEKIKTLRFLFAREEIAQLQAKGQAYLQSNPHLKKKYAFNQYQPEYYDDRRLISLNESGIIVIQPSYRQVIQDDGKTYSIPEQASVNTMLKDGEKVFFALYQNEGKIFSDNIEPYFDEVEDLPLLQGNKQITPPPVPSP
ncbi:MAG: tetratricopeptide repeat protein, partial [Bacteroidota bacterium]